MTDLKKSKGSKKTEHHLPLSGVLIKLLQGFLLVEDKRHWETLLIYQETIREYFLKLGLSLHLSTEEGYAFLKAGVSETHSDDADSSEVVEDLDFPSLVRKVPLSFEVSLLCVLLRESLEHFDSTVSDDHRLILRRVDMYEMLLQFFSEKADETKQNKRFDSIINRVVELGFLKELKGNQNSFEVRRVIKAQFDLEKLIAIKTQMMAELGQVHAHLQSGVLQ